MRPASAWTTSAAPGRRGTRRLVGLVEALAGQADETPEDAHPRGGADLRDVPGRDPQPAFRRKPREEQAHYRIEQIKALEAPDAEVPLPDRLRLHEIIVALWEDDGPFARSCLLRIIARVPLTYGPWRALKRIFKEAEARGDTEVFGALAARFDTEYAGRRGRGRPAARSPTSAGGPGDTSGGRPALPASYADVAADVLAHYADDTNWPTPGSPTTSSTTRPAVRPRRFHFEPTARRTC